MAKKQQIILTHGTGAPTFDNKVVKRGEVLVRHAEDAKDAALYTPNNAEDAFLEFPSKAWVSFEIENVNTTAGELGQTLAALQTEVEEINTKYQAKDAELDGLIDAVDVRVKANEEAIADLQAADAAMDAAYKAADEALGDQISALDTRVAANASAITELQAADTKIREDFEAADSAITEAYTLADTTLKNDLTAEINKKADQETVNTQLATLSGRVDVVEGNDAGKSMRTVAADEAAKKVAEVVANADADFDTLKEIADWILNDKEGAAALQTDVAKLKLVTAGYESEGAIKAADEALGNQISALDTRVAANASAITELQAADTKIREDFEAADSAITEAYTLADTTLKNDLTTEINKKADSSVVTTLDERVTDLVTEIEKNEETTAKALTDLDTRVIKVYEDFATADTNLKNELTVEIDKKADQETVDTQLEALSDRVTDVEDTYVSTIKYMQADGTYKELVAVNNVIDLSEMVIDGGYYA